MLLRARHRCIDFPRVRPLVMGIVNLAPGSFSGDGTSDPAAATGIAREMLVRGADIIDIGAASARTHRAPISAAEEISRLMPFLEAFPALASEEFPSAPFDADQLWPPLLSVNTWRPEVVAAALAAGGDLINDTGGLPDDGNAGLCAAHGAALLVMHRVGDPKEPHLEPRYPNVWESLEDFFAEKIALAEGAGLERERTLLDPGIDFAKQRDDNLRILSGLERLGKFDRPILLPVSRKTVIGEVLGIPHDPAALDAGTIACLVSGWRRGAHIFRVHNVAAAASSLKVLSSVEQRP